MSFKRFHESIEWPDIEGIEAFDFSVDGGGRDLVTDMLADLDSPVMVEVGAFLCGSTLQWLRANPTLRIISIDPWYDGDGPADLLERYNSNPVFDPCFSKISDRRSFIESVRRNGLYKSALANVAEYRDRVAPMRALSPDALMTLAKEWGVQPDAVYIDANKVGDDLRSAHQLWPNARLCGDDWTWGADQGYPMQTAVKEFVKDVGQRVEDRRATWLIHA